MQTAERIEQEARDMASQVQSWINEGDHRGTEIIGPVPCFFGRQNNLYRWQIVLRGPDPVPLLREGLVQNWLKDWRVEVDPISLL